METRHENVGEATESRSVSTEKLVNDLKVMLQRAQDVTAERAKAADRVIRDHPYQTIGVAFALGVLIGVLARRR